MDENFLDNIKIEKYASEVNILKNEKQLQKQKLKTKEALKVTLIFVGISFLSYISIRSAGYLPILEYSLGGAFLGTIGSGLILIERKMHEMIIKSRIKNETIKLDDLKELECFVINEINSLEKETVQVEAHKYKEYDNDNNSLYYNEINDLNNLSKKDIELSLRKK